MKRENHWFRRTFEAGKSAHEEDSGPLGAGEVQGSVTAPCSTPRGGTTAASPAPSGSSADSLSGEPLVSFQQDRKPGAGVTFTDAERRLAFIAYSLDLVIDELEGVPGRRVFGGAGTSMASYLRLVRDVAAGKRDLLPPPAVPEPQSLRVGPVESPRLRLIDGDSA